ncbi:MAG: zf-HC2 domain-containing protein [Nitriliruptorales bacterium]|nr:zf-HC2 domain-containing protein [Nitriliruptorales bacterium]
MAGDDLTRRCRRVQAWLPQLVDGSLAGWKRRLAERHVDGCERCAAELERQRRLASGLEDLGQRARGTRAEEHDPPDELLDTILARANDPGIRGRLAAPARGAVSGARPEYSLAALALLVAIAYLAYRAGRALLELFEER